MIHKSPEIQPNNQNPSIETRQEKPTDQTVFNALGDLNMVSEIEPKDSDFLMQIYRLNTIQQRDQFFENPDNRIRIISFQKKYEKEKGKSGVYKKIEMTSESISAEFGGEKFRADINLIHTLEIEEIHSFENHVGNWRKVPLFTIKGQRFILKEVSPEYFDEYSRIKDSEHRPGAREFVFNGIHYGLFEFKGERVMNFTDKDHLEQLCDIGIASARRLTTFDPNEGNLLIENDRLYYVDADLRYYSRPTTARAVLANIYHVVQHIPEVMEKTAYIETILFCIDKFKKEFTDIPLAEGESVEEIIHDELGPLLRGRNKLSPDVDQKIRIALLSLFSSK